MMEHAETLVLVLHGMKCDYVCCLWVWVGVVTLAQAAGVQGINNFMVIGE